MLAVFCLFAACILCISLTGCAGPVREPVSVQIPRDDAIVSYLGPEGTYTQEACGVFFEKRGTFYPYETVNAAVEALVGGKAIMP